MYDLLLALPLLASPAPVDDPPPVFQSLGFDEARERTAREGRLLILDAMTSWCAPCKQMDRTSWIDPRLVAWIDEHALAVQLDMDLHTELKQALRITAFPTIVLFRDGAELDRVVGYKTGDSMLSWLGANLEGRTATDVLLERLAALRGPAAIGATWTERFEIAEELHLLGTAADEVYAETLWLWRTDPGLEGSARVEWQYGRRGGVGSIMASLAREREDAGSAYRALRDELDLAVAADSASAEQWLDWLRLNGVVADEGRSAAWAERQTMTEAGRARLRTAESALFELLADRGSWRAAGCALEAPVAWAERSRDSLLAFEAYSTARDAPWRDPAQDTGADVEGGVAGGPTPALPMLPVARAAPDTSVTAALPMLRPGAPNEPTRSPGEQLAAQFRHDAGRRYAALLAAERGEEAQALAAVLLAQLDDAQTRVALVAAALRAGQVTTALDAHQRWLDEAAR